MSKKRKSFIVHNDSLNILDELTDEQAGVLFKAIRSYHLGVDTEMDTLTKIAFSPFKNQFERDAVKYENLCEKNRLIAENRYSAKSTSGKSGNQPLPSSTKSTDNDNDNDNDNDSKSKKEVTKDLVALAPKFNFKSELLALGVDKDILNDWLMVRKNKKASNTKTALTKILNQIAKTNLSVNDAIEFACSNDWKGFESLWYFNKTGQTKDILQISAESNWHLEKDEGF